MINWILDEIKNRQTYDLGVSGGIMTIDSKKLTKKIILGMILGLFLGVTLNWLLPADSPVFDILVNNLLKLGGDGFVRLLKMLVVPLVTFSLICGVCSLGDIKALGRVGGRALALYTLTTAVAITTGIIFAKIIGPGTSLDLSIMNEIENFSSKEAPSVTNVLLNIIPGNPFEAFAEGQMLQVIFFSMFFGICLVIMKDESEAIVSGIEKLNDAMMIMVTIVMLAAPIGVFCLMASTFAKQGLAVFIPLASYFATISLTLLFHGFVTLPLLLKSQGLSPLTFFKKFNQVQVFAFSTASSNATIPVNIEVSTHDLGVDNSVASFTLPLGATINMDGTAIMQGVATIFVSNLYKIPLTLTDLGTVIGMSILASIGTAGVPGVGLIMLAMVFEQVGLPTEGIALILGVDRILDMMRTVVNITGDAIVSIFIAKREGKLDIEKFNSLS